MKVRLSWLYHIIIIYFCDIYCISCKWICVFIEIKRFTYFIFHNNYCHVAVICIIILKKIHISFDNDIYLNDIVKFLDDYMSRDTDTYT